MVLEDGASSVDGVGDGKGSVGGVGDDKGVGDGEGSVDVLEMARVVLVVLEDGVCGVGGWCRCYGWCWRWQG